MIATIEIAATMHRITRVQRQFVEKETGIRKVTFLIPVSRLHKL